MNNVTIKKCVEYDKELIKHKINDIFISHNFIQKLKTIDKVLLKPNLLGSFEPEKAVTSHPVFIAALIEILRGYDIEISLYDNPGGSSKFKDVIAVTGIKGLAENYDIKILSPSNMGIYKFKSDPEIVISKIFIDTDAIINLCKMKTHSYTLFTGAIKNNYGVVPGAAKANYHKLSPHPTKFAETVVDIYSLVHKNIIFNLMDGILGMDGDGPSNGNAKNFGLILASENAVALDYVATKTMGYNPDKIPVTRLAADKLNIDLKKIKVDSEPGPDFVLKDVNIQTSKKFNLLLKILSAPLKNLIKHLFWTKPVFDEGRCTRCGKCVKFCPVSALSMPDNGTPPVVDVDKCIRCLCCVETCPENAVEMQKSFLAKVMM